jgi:hypothetical protein
VRYAAVIFGIGLILNWIWEVGQLFAYSANLQAIPIASRFIHCLPATIADALYITAVFQVGTLLLRDRRWIFHWNWRSVLAVMAAGAGTAMAVEVLALDRGWWSYGPGMPRVPMLGAGLLPVIQLAVLPVFTFLAARLVLK